MGFLLKKIDRKPLPDGAEVGTRKGQTVAKWVDRRTGKTRLAPVVTGPSGSRFVSIEAKTWTMRYRDESGRVVERSTNCHDRDMAQRVLNDVENRIEKIVGGVITATENRAMDFAVRPLSDHIANYIESLKGRGVTANTVKVYKAYLEEIADGCKFHRIADLSRTAAEKWLNAQIIENNMGARSCNARIAALCAFGSWLERQGRTTSNPFTKMEKRNEKADARRPRRALTVAEVEKLLDAARRRPLVEARRINRGKHKGELCAELKPETVAQLEALGDERALFYSVLLQTGLRHGEARSITVSQVVLDGKTPHLVLHAADEKSRRGAQIPLKADLANLLAEHITKKLRAARKAAETAGLSIPARLSADTPLFDVPAKMTKVFDADLVFAGIATRDDEGKLHKRDDQGRSLDIHCLRHTFGTMLSKSGVPLQIVQKAMRHSDPKLTMGTYSHLELLDVAGALASLPDFDMTGKQPEQEAIAANAPSTSPPISPLPTGTECHLVAFSGNPAPLSGDTEPVEAHSENANKDSDFQRLSSGGKGEKWWAIADLNCGPLACQARMETAIKAWKKKGYNLNQTQRPPQSPPHFPRPYAAMIPAAEYRLWTQKPLSRPCGACLMRSAGLS